MSLRYPKIETLYKRNDDHLVTGVIRCREFSQIRHWLVTEKVDGTNIRVSLEPWTGGSWGDGPQTVAGYCLRFYGRTDKAQIPAFLLQHLQDTFTVEKMALLWRGKQNCDLCGGAGRVTSEYTTLSACSCVEPYPITLYGEGYGARIQKGGGNYRPDSVSFRLFDVVVESIPLKPTASLPIAHHWLEWKNVCAIAEKLGIKTVPVMACAAELPEITRNVRDGRASQVAKDDRDDQFLVVPAEGIVARTDPYLYDSRGRPVRFKLKAKDYAQKKEETNA